MFTIVLKKNCRKSPDEIRKSKFNYFKIHIPAKSWNPNNSISEFAIFSADPSPSFFWTEASFFAICRSRTYWFRSKTLEECKPLSFHEFLKSTLAYVFTKYLRHDFWRENFSRQIKKYRFRFYSFNDFFRPVFSKFIERNNFNTRKSKFQQFWRVNFGA